MMRWSAGRFAWAVMGLWLVACGGTSQEDFPAAFSEAVCKWNARCGVIRDEGACIRNTRASLQQSLAAGDFTYPYYFPRTGSLRAGRIRFDEDRAARCVTRLRALSCESGEGVELVFDECNPYVGQREAGQECLFFSECVSGFYCDRGEEVKHVCSAGTCAPDAGLGETPGNGQTCARGLAPDEQNQCQPLRGEGDACSLYRPCAQNLSCDSRTSTCRADAKEGAACGPGVAACLAHLDCGDDGRCHRLANLGGACTPEGSGIIKNYEPRSVRPGAEKPNELRCKRDLRCVPGPDARGTCGERLAEGAPCELSEDCRPLLTCVRDSVGLNGTCQTLAKEGAACGQGRECVAGAWCDGRSGVCAAQGKKLGDTCDTSSLEALQSSCVPGFDCEEGRCVPAFGGTCEG